MAVEEGILPVGDTGENLDTTIIEQTDGTPAHREVIVNADPEDNDARQNIVQPDTTEFYAARTIDHQLAGIAEILNETLKTQKRTLKLLETAFEHDLYGDEETNGGL